MSPNNRLLDEMQESPNHDHSAARGNGHAGIFHHDAGFTPIDVLRCTARHKRKVICFAGLTIAVAIGAAIFWPKTYRSEGKVYVRVGRQSVGQDPTTSLNRGTVALQVTREEEMNTVVDLLRSRAMMEKVVDAVGPEVILNPTQQNSEGKPPESPSWIARVSSTLQDWKNNLTKDLALSPRERAINALQSQIDVQNVRKTDVINVTHDGRSPQLSQRIVASLLNSCLEQHVEINRSPKAHEVLTEEASAMKTKLARAEDALRLFKNQSGLTSPPEQRLALVNHIAHLEEEVASTTAAMVAAEAENRELAKELTTVAPVEELGQSTGNTNFAADGMRQQLFALQLKEKELASRLTDKHFELRQVREQIAAAAPIVEAMEPTRTQTSSGRNHIHDELRLTYLRQAAVLASQRARLATLKNQWADANYRLQVLNDNEIRIAQLQRDEQILDASYRRYVDSREQARLEDSLDRENVSNMTVAEPATLSMQPVRPQRSLILMAGVFFAVFGGPCLALAAEHLETAHKGHEDNAKPLRRPIPASPAS
jgi:polysaccharide biosynthesis protein PslE